MPSMLRIPNPALANATTTPKNLSQVRTSSSRKSWANTTVTTELGVGSREVTPSDCY